MLTVIAVGGLQLVQGAVGSFNPSWAVKLLVAAAGLCATAAVSRQAALRKQRDEQEEREELRRRSLRIWPLQGFEVADPQALGVFPARRDVDRTTYVARPEVDEALREALKESALVLLIGPPRAGKSRTALEAGKEALAEIPVIVPRDAASLGRMLPSDELGDPEPRVLWLDGLERFVKRLDAETLEELSQPEHQLTIVATVREATWQRLLAAEGAQGEAAKAVAARARVFELALPLGPQELEEARRVYPDVEDFSSGIGRVLATSGREPQPPPAPAPAGEDAPPAAEEKRAPRDHLLVAAVLGCVLSLAAVLLLLATGNFEQPKPPTVAEQAAKARREGAAGPRVVVASERADFRDSGEASYIFVFGDGGAPGTRPRSDEIQIWDRHGDELERALRFEPREVFPGEVALFQFRHIGDIDGDGADELVGGYGTPAIRGELLLPFAVDWNDDADRYDLVSLAPGPASLATRAKGADVAGLRAAYRKQVDLRDVKDERLALSGYRSQDFAVSANPHRLVNSYVADISRDSTTRQVELQPHIFVRTAGLPRVNRCKLTDTETLVTRIPSARVRALHSAILEHWLELSRNRFCVRLG